MMGLALEVDSLDGVDEAVKALYKEADGKFRLDVEGIPDVSGLKAKNEELLGELKQFKSAKQKAEEAAELARQEALKKSGDVEALENSWKEKLKAIEESSKTEAETLRGSLAKLTTGQAATRIAAELAIQGSADVLLPHIQSRLKTEFIEGQPRTVVLDKDGKLSALSLDDLKNEIKSNPAFAPLIVGSKASGAGRQGADGKGGGAAKTLKRSEFDALSPADKMKHIQENGRGSVVDD